nr:MAG TPA: hypothetical protein [Caudoviricetes sp.]
MLSRLVICLRRFLSNCLKYSKGSAKRQYLL